MHIFAPKPTIYVQFSGHPGESYYLIVSGSVDVVIDSEGGHSKYVNELTTGQGFGEVALVNKVRFRKGLKYVKMVIFK